MSLRIALPAILCVLFAACSDEGPEPKGRVHVAVCGNAVVEEGEECDEGASPPASCPWGVESCTLCTVACTRVEGKGNVCGDGKIDPTHETCDDGNTVTEICEYGRSCSICDASCELVQPPVRRCGDGVIDADGGEICDDGRENDDRAPGACRSDCRPARCGDGVVDPGEGCDPPGQGRCRDDCSLRTCGDGILDPGEHCEPALDPACRSNCTLPTCGDGALDPGEECDDGAFVPLHLAAHGNDLCAIVEGGAVRCWSDVPELDRVPATLPPAAQIAVGRGFACILDGEGAAHCWGDEIFGGILAPPEGPFVSLVAGVAHACALREDGTIACWGDQRGGEAPTSEGWVQLAAGHGFTCALAGDGSLACWGSDTDRQTAAPTGTFTEVAASGARACAIRATGGAVCWGRLMPAAPSAALLHGLAMGGDAACALDADGNALCWGEGTEGASGPWERLVLAGGHVCGFGPRGLGCWGGEGRLMAVNADGIPGACRADCTLPTCGDGVVDPGEDCEGPGCPDCRRPGRCGDGTVQYPWESCDDGNQVHESCGYGESCVVCDASCRWAPGLESRCGDGRIDFDAGESCDDGVFQPRFVQHSVAGYGMGCGLRADGEISCWGSVKLLDEPAGPFVTVGAGTDFACALRPAGEIVCWGEPAYAQTHPPEGIFVALETGPRSACALRDDSRIVCWGDRQVPVPDTPGWQAIGVNDSLVCGLDFEGAISCWGPRAGDVDAPPEGRFTALAVGIDLHCAIGEKGRLACWGSHASETYVPDVAVEQIDAGRDRICGIDRTGAVICLSRSESWSVPGRFTRVSVGDRSYCVLAEDGATHCTTDHVLPRNDDVRPNACRTTCSASVCGDGVVDAEEACDEGPEPVLACGYGEAWCLVCDATCTQTYGTTSWCGDGVIDPAREACDDGNRQMSRVGIGADFACGLSARTEGSVFCWGRDDVGQSRPPAGLVARELAVGARHACAVDERDGYTYCWGADDRNQLQAPAVRDFALLAAGRDFTCAREDADGLICWGDVPFRQPEVGDFQYLAAGERHLCGVLRGTDEVRCFGDDQYGQASPPPGTTAPLGRLAVGRNHACAQRVGGGIVCWGDDSAGQATPPSGLTSARVLVAGDRATCALPSTGTDWICWGDPGSIGTSASGATILGISRWATGFACGRLLTSYEVECWGTPAVSELIPPPGNSDTRSGACRNDCTLPRCGDGVLDPGEVCDHRRSGVCTPDCQGFLQPPPEGP